MKNGERDRRELTLAFKRKYKMAMKIARKKNDCNSDLVNLLSLFRTKIIFFNKCQEACDADEIKYYTSNLLDYFIFSQLVSHTYSSVRQII